MATPGFGFPPLKGKQITTLPGRTEQMSYQPASGHAPAARDSNPCRREGERRKTQSAADTVCVGGKGYMLISSVAGRPRGRSILTARGSAWARTRGGCTACTGTRGRPGWPGSPVLTTAQPLAAAGSQSSLKQHTLSG